MPDGSICCFCQTTEKDEALYGKFYKYQDIITHYFCLLLASKILQRGSDEDGILGFLPNDIVNEVKRGKNLSCVFCGKRGATIGCYAPKCKVHFHLPCGRKQDTFHQFFGEFKSFCPKHRIRQKINRQVVKAMSGRKAVNCVICLEPVSAKPAPNTLWAPCCSKEAWFHRLCVQRLALSAGYFFKCPLCNNTKQFVEAMRTYGIWVPEQDASWEAEPERYSSLLERHNSCDAKSCRCRQGRTFHLDNTRWEIKLCVDCGSQGMHVQCGNLRVNDDWVCPICSSVTVQKENLAQTNKGNQDRRIGQNSSRRTSRRDQHVIRRISTRQSEAPVEPEDGEDEDVDVVGNKNEEEGKIPRNEEQLGGLLENTPDDHTPQTPLPSVSISKEKGKSRSGLRSSKRRGRPRKSSQSPTDTVTHHKEAPSNATSIAKEKRNFEIIDIDDNSDGGDDDDVQILFTPNVKFIKTNEGVSVPVVTVPASGPSWDSGVVASGEPCQPSLSSSPTLVDVEEDVQSVEKCQPSTSQSCDSLDQHLESVNQVIISGEPPISDEEIEILEDTNQQPCVSILREKLMEASTQTCVGEISDSSDANEEILFIDVGHTTEVPASSPSPLRKKSLSKFYSQHSNNVTDQSVVSQTVPGHSSFLSGNTSVAAGNTEKFGGAQFHMVPSHFDKGQNSTMIDDNSPSIIPVSRNVSGLVPSSWLDAPSSSVAIRTSTSSQVGGESVVGSSRSLLSGNSNVTVVHSTFALPPSLLPAGTRAVVSSSIPILQTNTLPSQEPEISYVPQATQSLNSFYDSRVISSAKHASVLNNAMSAPAANENTSGLHANVITQVSHNRPQNGLLVDSAPSQGQVCFPVPGHGGSDDWSYSVQVIPGSGLGGQGNVHVTRRGADDLPEVILERNPGPVPYRSSLWSQLSNVSGLMTQTDVTKTGSYNAPIANCESPQLMSGSRERKQKLIERHDLNQCFSASNPHSATEHGEKMFSVPGRDNRLSAPVMVAIPSDIMPPVVTPIGDTSNNIYIMVNRLPNLMAMNSSQSSFQN